jgi:hypothetical protein
MHSTSVAWRHNLSRINDTTNAMKLHCKQRMEKNSQSIIFKMLLKDCSRMHVSMPLVLLFGTDHYTRSSQNFDSHFGFVEPSLDDQVFQGIHRIKILKGLLRR